jgi:hypothetical protein
MIRVNVPTGTTKVHLWAGEVEPPWARGSTPATTRRSAADARRLIGRLHTRQTWRPGP